MDMAVLVLDNLKWLLPIVFGSLALIIAARAIAAGSGGWPAVAVAVVAAALVGASVFRTVVFDKDGIRIETALSAAATVTTKLEQAAKDNASAIDLLNKRVDTLSSLAKTLQTQNTIPPATATQIDQLFKDSQKINDIFKIQSNNLKDITGSNKVLRDAVGMPRM